VFCTSVVQSGAAALGARVSHPGGVRKIVGGDGRWKRRGRDPLGKRSAFPTFPPPRRLPEGSYEGCVGEPKPGESLIIRGLKTGGRSLGTHLLLQDSLKENVPNFENLPRFLRDNAAYMEFLFLFYGGSNRVYKFGLDYLLLGVQKHLKSCFGRKSVYSDLADLLQAAHAASGNQKQVDPKSLARKLDRLREPSRNWDLERLLDYYLRQNQT